MQIREMSEITQTDTKPRHFVLYERGEIVTEPAREDLEPQDVLEQPLIEQTVGRLLLWLHDHKPNKLQRAMLRTLAERIREVVER